MMPAATLRSALLAATVLAPLAASLVAPHAARADNQPASTAPTTTAPPVSAADAQALEGELHTWLTGVLGPNIKLPDHPFAVRAEGDHYVLSLAYAGEFPAVPGLTITGDPLTVSVKPLDATRWSILGVQIPSPLRVDDPGAKPPQMKSYAIKIAEQTTTGVLDPSFATASSYDTVLRGYTSVTEGDSGTQTSHLDRLATRTVMAPATAGRVDIDSTSAGENLVSSATLPDGTPLSFTVAQLSGTGHVDGILFSQIGAIIRSAADMGRLIAAAESAPHDPSTPQDVPPQAPHPPIPEAARPAAHELLAALRELLGSYEQAFALKQIKFDAGGHGGTLNDMMVSLGGGAPGGRLDLHMALAMDGLDSPEVPPGLIHDYLPRHLSLRPRISGVPSQDLADLISAAIDSDGTNDDELGQMAFGLLAKGPLSIGIDDLSLEMGPAALSGSGGVQVSSPVDMVAQASLRLKGFDALMADASQRPELAQAAPVMIFLKGIGKQEGDAVVWNVSYQDKKLLVNGTDLSAMMPK